jgi:hypothetical protein
MSKVVQANTVCSETVVDPDRDHRVLSVILTSFAACTCRGNGSLTGFCVGAALAAVGVFIPR